MLLRPLFSKDSNRTINFSGKLLTSLQKFPHYFFFFLSLIFKVSLKHQDVGLQPTEKSFISSAMLLELWWRRRVLLWIFRLCFHTGSSFKWLSEKLPQKETICGIHVSLMFIFLNLIAFTLLTLFLLKEKSVLGLKC